MTTIPAVAGTIALSLGAVPAHAAEPQPREHNRDRAGASTDRDAPRFGRLGMSRAVTSTAPRQPADHIVEPGDTITGIAIRHGLRTIDLLTWNNLGWTSLIRPGQRLSLTAPASPAPAPQPAAAQPAPQGAGSHTVAAGDTPWSIARSYGVSVDELLAANGMQESSVIYPGQTLVIPGDDAVAENLLLMSTRDDAPPEPEPQPENPKPESPQGTTHTVAAGETLWGIAQQYGTSVDAILQANGLSEGAIIYPGQTLTIPSGSVEPQPEPEPESSEPEGDHEQLDANLDAAQSSNAQLIIRIGRELGIPDRGIAIGLATAMVESSLRNLDWGDRDSLGLFQQRPSQGWGTPEQILDADRSTRVFYGGPHDPNGDASRGLLDVSGWESMGFSEAAQAVQISAYPDRYGQWEQASYRWLAELG